MKKTYDIYNLYGDAWCEAIYNVTHKVNMKLGTHFFPERDATRIEDLAHSLGIRFDEKGNLVK